MAMPNCIAARCLEMVGLAPALSDPSIFVLVLVDTCPCLLHSPGLCTCLSFISSLLCSLGPLSPPYVFLSNR